MEIQKTLNSKMILRKKKKAGDIVLLDLKLYYYKAIEIETVWYW